VAEGVKARLREIYPTLNPAALLRQIETRQQALWKLAVHSDSGTMSQTA
jgi:hypothetical protein